MKKLLLLTLGLGVMFGTTACVVNHDDQPARTPAATTSTTESHTIRAY